MCVIFYISVCSHEAGQPILFAKQWRELIDATKLTYGSSLCIADVHWTVWL